MSTYTDDEIRDYLMYWYQDSVTTDYEIALDTGYLDICVYLLQSAGVFECDEKEDAIGYHLGKMNITHSEFRKQSDVCFKGCIVMTNPNTNETFWIPGVSQGVDYLITEDECAQWGYTEKSLFGVE